MLVFNYKKNWKHEYRNLVSEKEGRSGFYYNQIFADYRLSLGGRWRWSFEKCRRSCSHFVCTCFIVVGTRLFKYRKLPMEVCIFVKYSKLGGGRGNIQSINFNLDFIALPETFILLQLNYYSIYIAFFCLF